MRYYYSAFFLLVALLAAGSVHAGFNFNSFDLKIESVRVAGDPLDAGITNQPFAFAETLEQRMDRAWSDSGLPLRPDLLETLQKYPPFAGLNTNEVQMKFVLIRRAIVDAIRVISKEDPELADCLVRLYGSWRLCISFGGTPGVNAEIREDGSPTCGDEAINLYKFPCPTNALPLYAPEMFELLNTLAHEGQHALQAGYRDVPPIGSVPFTQYQTNRATEALTNQCREVETALAELMRMDAMEAVLDEIIANVQLPQGATGIAASIGMALLNDASLTPAQKQEKAGELKAFILGILKPVAVQALECRTAYKRVLIGWLGGEISQTNPIVRGIRDTGWFRTAAIREFGEFRFVSYLAGGVRPVTNIVGNNFGLGDLELYTPIVRSSNVLRQVGVSIDSQSVTQRDFSITGLDSVTGGMEWGGQFWFIGDAMDGVNGAIWTYEDTDDDGLLDAASGAKVLESPDFRGGSAFGLNAPLGAVHVFNRSSGQLYELTDYMMGLPTNYEFRGEASSLRESLHVGFSPDLTYAFAGNDVNRPFSYGLRWSFAELDGGSSQYQPLGDDFEPFKYAEVTPALGLKARESSIQISATAIPGATLTVYNENGVSTPFGTSVVDPMGHAVFHLTSGLTANQKIKFICSGGFESPVYQVPPILSVQFAQPELLPGNQIRVELQSGPRKDHEILCSTHLDTWVVDVQSKSDRFGSVHFVDQIDPGNMFHSARKLVSPPKARPDSFVVAPGQRLDLHINYNDRASPNATYEFASPTGFHPDVATLLPKGLLSFSALSDVPSMTLNYWIIEGGETSAVTSAHVYMDYGMLTNLVVFTNSLTGGSIVNVPCLVLGGKHYPKYQFRLRNAPGDTCTEPHWHSPDNPLVYSLESTNSPLSDSSHCGYGREVEVVQEDFIETLPKWKAFLTAFPPP